MLCQIKRIARCESLCPSSTPTRGSPWWSWTQLQPFTTQHVMSLSQAIPVSVQQDFGRFCTLCETQFSAVEVPCNLCSYLSPLTWVLITWFSFICRHSAACCSISFYSSLRQRGHFFFGGCWREHLANSSEEPHATSINSLTVRWVDVLLWNNISVTRRTSFLVLKHISYQMDLKKGTLLLCLTEDKKCLSVRNVIYPKNFHKRNLLNQMNSFDYSIHTNPLH